MGLLFTAMVYVAGYIFLLFVAVCLGAHAVWSWRPRFAASTILHANIYHTAFCELERLLTPVSMLVATPACGLYYMAELAEEYTVLTKKLMYISTAVSAALHAPPAFDILHPQLSDRKPIGKPAEAS